MFSQFAIEGKNKYKTHMFEFLNSNITSLSCLLVDFSENIAWITLPLSSIY